MQIVQEMEADGALTPEIRDGLLLNFLEDIERLNKHIAWHQSLEKPDEFSIGEFSDRRDSYIEQVKLLRNYYGLDVKPLPSSNQPSQQRAA